MGEAVLILTRARGAIAEEIRTCERRLEKYPEETDEFRAAHLRRDVLREATADITEALIVLGGPQASEPEPVADEG
jgi:predicted DNA-binding protein YlxM (UPF0122 family)